MNARFGPSLLLALLLLTLPSSLAAQGWDPVKSATGWASFDRDGSCVFLDRAGRKLETWSRDGGLMGEVDLAKLPFQGEKWVLDPSGNAWVVAGTTLQRVDKSGKPGASITLPAEVADLTWDARYFYLSYRTREPFLERRDLKSGSVLSSYGNRPAKDGTSAAIQFHLVIKEDGLGLLTSGNEFQLDVLDFAKGTKVETLTFTYRGQAAPVLVGKDRGALAWWLNRNIALMAVPASQFAPGEFQGLVLARLDLAKRDLVLIPTGLDEKTTLAGILDNDAVLVAPAGGLTFFPIP